MMEREECVPLASQVAGEPLHLSGKRDVRPQPVHVRFHSTDRDWKSMQADLGVIAPLANRDRPSQGWRDSNVRAPGRVLSGSQP